MAHLPLFKPGQFGKSKPCKLVLRLLDSERHVFERVCIGTEGNEPPAKLPVSGQERLIGKRDDDLLPQSGVIDFKNDFFFNDGAEKAVDQ